jgi:hypothetical protein
MGPVALGAAAVTGRGALLAVCGVGDDAQTADVSRLLATELGRRTTPGAVLLTAARGRAADRVLEPALGRHAIVVADIGPLNEHAGDALALAAAVICTFRADLDPLRLAAALTGRAARTAPSARWHAVATAAAETSPADLRRVAAALPQWVGATTLLATTSDAEPAVDIASTTLVATLA